MLLMLAAALVTQAAPVPASGAPSPETARSAAAPHETLTHDNRGRPQIGVMVNGQGPFPMVVDTAAQTSLLSPSLADELHLPAMASDLTINGATGSAQAQFYPVDRFASALFDARRVGILRLPNPGSTSARGIVGMEYFARGKLVFDTTGAQVLAAPSAPPAPGFVAHKGNVRDGTLLVVPIVINGVALLATVDSGAGVSLANHAVLKALGWADDDARLALAGGIRGATAATSAVRMARMDKVQIGPVRLADVPLFFTPAPNDGAAEEPMITLGSDILGLLEGYAVDFPRGELQIRVPAAPGG